MNQQTTALTERATANKSGRTPAKTRSSNAAAARTISVEERECMIAQVAYFRAERRGFVPGQELEDWLEAEREIRRDFDAG